jgi:hypothetical protein
VGRVQSFISSGKERAPDIFCPVSTFGIWYFNNPVRIPILLGSCRNLFLQLTISAMIFLCVNGFLTLS